MGLVLVAGCSSRGVRHVTVSVHSLARLDAAVRAVSANRGFLLASVDAVQKGASSLDATDQVCTTGEGVAARTSHRVSLPLTHQARVALTVLPRQVAAYRSSLVGLAAASPLVGGAARESLVNAVRDGQAEATAVEAFRAQAARVWPEYDHLDADEDTWITRAVTPWYRTPQEGAAAYAVLVDDHRAALDAARRSLGAAAEAVSGPSMAESVTLAAADKALAGFRTQH